MRARQADISQCAGPPRPHGSEDLHSLPGYRCHRHTGRPLDCDIGPQGVQTLHMAELLYHLVDLLHLLPTAVSPRFSYYGLRARSEG